MSLINEALKKAQRQRAENPAALPPSVSDSTGAPATPVVKRRPPMPARTQALLLGGGVAVLLMAGSLTFVLLNSDSPTQSSPPPKIVQQPVEPTAVSVPQAEEPPVEVAVKLPEVAPVEPVAVAPIVPAQPPVQSTSATPPGPVEPTANPKVYEILEALRITGIRASETDPKVIMNERVYRLNDIVDRGTQLRLTRVEATALVFVDGTGYEYRKSF